MNDWKTFSYEKNGFIYTVWQQFGLCIDSEKLKRINKQIEFELAWEEEKRRQDWEHQIKLTAIRIQYQPSRILFYISLIGLLSVLLINWLN